jgi:hypothetical protein
MQPVNFPAANCLVSPPLDERGLQHEPVPVRVIGPMQTTVWQPSELEIARLKAGAFVTVTLYSPYQHPLVGLGVADARDLEMRSAAAG